MKTLISATVAAACLLGPLATYAANPVVTSPDGLISIEVAEDGSRFSVKRRGETVIAPSPLGLDLADAPALGRLVLVSRSDSAENRIIPLIATKAASARDHYRATTLALREAGEGGRRLFIDVRAYNEGVALRYRMDDVAPVRLRGERTAFVLPDDPTCLATEFVGSHEKPFERQHISELATDKGYDVPLVCATVTGRTHYAITQSYLKGYTGASLWREGGTMQVRLSAVPGRQGPAYVSNGGLSTAWRVVMMADRAGDLIASPLVGNLNPPPNTKEYGDFSWVKPGKVAWNWWSGPSAGAKSDMDSFRRYIDFAAEAGLPYVLLDAGWAWGTGPCCEALAETDITRAVDGVDMPALVRYAESKGVGLMLWAHWKHMAARMDEVLDTWVRWGIRGIKVDFMERDDQEVVDFHERIAAATAKRHLLLDLHGAYMPAGLQRSYPNFITQEGVMGAEWNKWTKYITPRHNLTLPYTRMLTGPMDYTPGGFRNSTPATFDARDVLPQTQTTRGQALAMYVVFDSPLQMVSDDPDAYRDVAGFEFIRRVPTAWDETRFISGEPAQDIVLARRHGQTWYLGAMTADSPRTARVSLRFLPPGRYRATVWEDGSTPNDVRRSERTVTARDVMALHLSAAGGAAVIIDPLRSH